MAAAGTIWPVVLSASRATDVPAFYADWFMHRLRAGFFRWANPFNAAQVQTVSVAKTRAIVFWTKDPAGIEPHLDELDRRGLHYYFQYTLNDYEAEGLEPGLPPLAARIDSFRRLADRLGPERVIWRLDPLLLTDRLGVPEWLDRAAQLMAQLARHTRKLVFSFADIAAYPAVRRNLARAGTGTREFAPVEMEEFARGAEGYGPAARMRVPRQQGRRALRHVPARLRLLLRERIARGGGTEFPRAPSGKRNDLTGAGARINRPWCGTPAGTAWFPARRWPARGRPGNRARSFRGSACGSGKRTSPRRRRRARCGP